MATNRPWWKRALSWVATGITTAAAGVASYFFVKTAANDVQENGELTEIEAVIGLGLASGFFLQLAFNRLLTSNRFYLRRIRDGFNHYKNKLLPYELSALIQVDNMTPEPKALDRYDLLSVYFSVRLGSMIGDFTYENTPKLLNYLHGKCTNIQVMPESENDLTESPTEEKNEQHISSYETYQRNLKKYLSWNWAMLGIFSLTCYTSAWTLPNLIEEDSWKKLSFLYLSGLGFLSSGFFLGDLAENVSANDKQEIKATIGYLTFASLTNPGEEFYHHISLTISGTIIGWLHAYNRRTTKTTLAHMNYQIEELRPYMDKLPDFFETLQPYLEQHQNQINKRRKCYCPLKWLILVNSAITPGHFFFSPLEEALPNTILGYSLLFFYWLIGKQNYSPYEPNTFNSIFRFFSSNLITAGGIFSFSDRIRRLLLEETEYTQLNLIFSRSMQCLPWAMLGAFYLNSLVTGNEDELLPIDQSRYNALMDYLSSQESFASLSETTEEPSHTKIALTKREIAFIMANFRINQQDNQTEEDYNQNTVLGNSECGAIEIIDLEEDKYSISSPIEMELNDNMPQNEDHEKSCDSSSPEKNTDWITMSSEPEQEIESQEESSLGGFSSEESYHRTSSTKNAGWITISSESEQDIEPQKELSLEEFSSEESYDTTLSENDTTVITATKEPERNCGLEQTSRMNLLSPVSDSQEIEEISSMEEEGEKNKSSVLQANRIGFFSGANGNTCRSQSTLEENTQSIEIIKEPHVDSLPYKIFRSVLAVRSVTGAFSIEFESGKSPLRF